MSDKLERLSQIGIIIIALAAVFVAVWQVKILQDHNKLSVRPLMDFLLVTNEDSVLNVSISNRGIGPAIIQEISYTYQDSVHREWYGILSAADLLEATTTQMNYGKNTVLSPNTEFKILGVKKKNHQQIGISVKIIYQSIYEEEFELNLTF
ncbi:MAG: hypothetical protein ABJP45_13765 [Cyclobacteriaceae bacterium]